MKEQTGTEGGGKLRSFLRYRQHPIKILGYTSKSLWLLLIPIVKNLITSDFNIQGWIRTYWFDLFTVLGIIAFAVFRWLFVFYKIEDNRITAHTGPFGLLTTTICFSQITAMRFEQSIFYRTVHASTMYLETPANSVGKFEIKLVISEKNVQEIYKMVTSKSSGETEYSVQQKNSLVLLYSLIFSSFLSGLVIYAAAMLQFTKMVGAKLNDIAVNVTNGIEKVDNQTLKLSESVPKLMIIVGGAIAIGWFVSFMTNLLDNWNFKAERRGGQLLVESGKFKKNCSAVNRDKINYYDIRQSLLMKLTGISSVHLQCSGYGKKKKNAAVLIPMKKNNETMASMKQLEPGLGSQRSDIKPRKSSFKVFLLIPLFFCVLPAAAGLIAKRFVSENMSRDITYFIVVLTIPLVWYLTVQIFAYRATSAGMTEDTCTLCFCPAYKFHKVIIPMENITSVWVQQNPIQRTFGTCTLCVNANSEKRKTHKVSRLPYKEVCGMLAKYIDGRFLDGGETGKE